MTRIFQDLFYKNNKLSLLLIGGKLGYAYEYLSADDIAARLESEQPEKARIQASRMFFQNLSDLINRGKELVIESTLAGLGFQGVIRRLRQTGYTIVIIFVFLETPDTCIARVKDRVRKGGHDVPEADVVRRFFRSKDNFWHIYRHEADFWCLFCNSDEYFQGVALGKKDNYMINNDKLFHLFSKNKKE